MVRCLGFAAPLSEPIGELPGGRLEIHFSDLHLVVDSFVDIFSLQEEEPGFDVPFGNPDGDSFLNGPLNASGISQCVGQPLRSLLNGLLVRIRSDDQGNVLEGSPPIGPDLNGILAVDPLLPGSTTRRERKDSDLLRISSQLEEAVPYEPFQGSIFDQDRESDTASLRHRSAILPASGDDLGGSDHIVLVPFERLNPHGPAVLAEEPYATVRGEVID